MEPKERIVTSIPLEELWTNKKVLKSNRRRYVDKNDIVTFLKRGQIEFVIAEVGYKLIWIDTGRCFDFWKEEVKKKLIDPEMGIENLPGEWGYLASEWFIENKDSVILLEKLH